MLSEYNSASFIDNDTIAVADFLEKEEYENEEDETPARVNVSGTLDFYDLASCERTFSKVLETNIGTFMPLGLDHLVSFFEHPKVINIKTGMIVHEWEALKTGEQTSSIIWGIKPVPPIAFDAIHSRFAVATAEYIEVDWIKF